MKRLDFGRALGRCWPPMSAETGAILRVIGAGEAFDSGLGNNSCLLHGAGLPTLLLDCGYQIPERLWALPELYPRIDAICLTHTHADHAFGIVPLLTRFWEERRRRPLHLLGRRGLRIYTEELFTLGYPNLYQKLPFLLRYREFRAGESWRWRGLLFRFAATQHSVENLGVRIDQGGRGRRWSIGFSGDGQLTEEAKLLFKDVDLLVQEVYTIRQRTPIHYDLEQLQNFASGAPLGRIGVTHHSRKERREILRRLKALRRKDSRWIGLAPGMEFALG